MVTGSRWRRREAPKRTRTGRRWALALLAAIAALVSWGTGRHWELERQRALQEHRERSAVPVGPYPLTGSEVLQ